MSSKELPKHARVAVIGGGVVGCSVLYHLAKKVARHFIVGAARAQLRFFLARRRRFSYH